MKWLAFVMIFFAAITHSFGQAAFHYAYEPYSGDTNTDQCGNGFDLTVYDLDEKPRVEFFRGEQRNRDKQTYEIISYDFRSTIERPFLLAFASNLVASGLDSLTQPPIATNCTVLTALTSRLGKKEIDLFLYTPPTGGVQKTVHDLTRAFGANLWQVYPKGATVTTQVWEKTTAPAREIDLSHLLDHPKEFLRKRVLVEGYYHCYFECSMLSPEPSARGLWVGAPASDASSNAIHWGTNCWVRAEGTYQAYFVERDDKPHGGHMGMSLGELTNITFFEPLKKKAKDQ